MCGIAGILTSRPELPLQHRLARMRDALRHRGPDDEGIEQLLLPGGYRLGLVHTRLAIQDLTSAGHQPMTERESQSWIVYNGEIYNHLHLRRAISGTAFLSSSDTETLLAAWVRSGPAILPSLRGMFAFALYDARRRQFWLVRDRLGIKPLYVSQVDPQTWIFASEVRAILASDLVARRLHPAALHAYLAFGAAPAPWTLVEGVESLLPGECWRFDLGPARLKPERTRYWQLPSSQPSRPARSGNGRYHEAVERLRPILAEGIKLHTLADVPVGVFLSGGIDSSAITALVSHAGRKPRTFSIVFGEKEYDESAASRCAARELNTEHNELLLRPQEVLEDLPAALAAYDQPSLDGLNTYFVSKAVRRCGIKVALSGLGGDELFAGYPHFRHVQWLDHPCIRTAARWLCPLLAPLNPGCRLARLNAVLRSGRSRLGRYAACRRVMLPERSRLLARSAAAAGPFAPLPDGLAKELDHWAAGCDPVNAHSLLEMSLYMPNTLLRDADQMSMAHGLEVRVPLLDHELVEAVLQVPGAVKLSQGRAGGIKGLLTDALPQPLPKTVVARQKTGFVLPWERWLRKELRASVREILGDRRGAEAAGLETAEVGRLWGDFQDRRGGVRAADILCLTHLLHWVGRHGIIGTR